MIYSSANFIVLLLATLGAYVLARSHSQRFWTLFVSSTVFYAWTGWVDFLIFELVMIASWATVELSVRYPHRRKFFVTAGIVMISAHLFTWKYLPWAASQIQSLFPQLGNFEIKLAFPIGISFYTLQKIAYLVDFYRRAADPVRLKEFLLFNGFFAQLIAGPITRASVLIPQIRKLDPIQLENLWSGTALFLGGFFKKRVIGDNLAIFVDGVFDRPGLYDTPTLILGVVAFASQMWADFSGYTDMGRGAARIFGIRLPENFLSPFLSRGPSEFWKRWHITLSEWIRDYVFIPLWMRHGTKMGGAWVLLLTMFLSGLWHGASWTFVLYGFYWGVLIVAEHFWKKTKIFRSGYKALPVALQWMGSISLMLVLMIFSRLLFRARTFEGLATYLRAMVAGDGQTIPGLDPAFVLSLILLSFLFQVLSYRKLNEGAKPLWALWYESSLQPSLAVAYRTRWAMGALGVGVGIVFAALFASSLGLSISATPRAFIYFQI